jgi:8-amino-7-oxononanoate synthase
MRGSCNAALRDRTWIEVCRPTGFGVILGFRRSRPSAPIVSDRPVRIFFTISSLKKTPLVIGFNHANPVSPRVRRRLFVGSRMIARPNRIGEKILHYKEAERLQSFGLYPFFRPIQSEQDTEVTVGGRTLLMFGSNSYLGLTNHPKVKEAAAKALLKYGTGCAGSRFLNGTLDIHLECEARLASFVGKEAALLYSTGFQANQGVISALVGREDYVLLDRSDHASIVDGARLSFGRTLRFKHNDMKSLEKALMSLPCSKGKLIVADGVFSMDGDLFDLPSAVRLADQYNSMIMIDDAHGIGVMGPEGRGTADFFGLTDKVDLIMATFSKSLASLGGFIASDRRTIEYLKHTSRALIFSASPAPASVAAVMAAIDILNSEPERIRSLWNNTRRMTTGLKGMGYNLGNTSTPILPVIIGDDLKCLQMCLLLQEEGVFVNPVIYPGVEARRALLRVSLMATHTFAQIDRALDKFEQLGKRLDLLPFQIETP